MKPIKTVEFENPNETLNDIARLMGCEPDDSADLIEAVALLCEENRELRKAAKR